MIKNFRHKGLEQFFNTGNKSGIQPQHVIKINVQLTAIHAAESPDDLRAPVSWRLHKLTGDLVGFWSLTVNGNWRVIFKFYENDIELVDYLDYH
jgi:proteic killer suppression protein